jgi:hypothetical protein
MAKNQYDSESEMHARSKNHETHKGQTTWLGIADEIIAGTLTALATGAIIYVMHKFPDSPFPFNLD